MRLSKLSRLGGWIGTIDVRIGFFGKVAVYYPKLLPDGRRERVRFLGTPRQVEWHLQKLYIVEWKRQLLRSFFSLLNKEVVRDETDTL